MDTDDLPAVLFQVAERMQDNYPYFHPLYAGQMLKPPHPIARLAYALSLWINPNNHALDGGRASSAMEKEAIAGLAAMMNWQTHLGHICSGGTIANLEALWASRNLQKRPKIVASSQAHYTHERICGVLGIDFQSVPCNRQAQMDPTALDELLKTGQVGTVVATMGATATGAVDPLADILELREKYGFRLHVDAAYGGYFTLIEDLDPKTRRHFDQLHRVDSIVIDPHKHGLQPYGCGCVIFKDPAVALLYKHDSPYTYYTSADLHLGEISLECSRPGASAVALWATQRHLPLEPGGEFSSQLAKCRVAALTLYERLQTDRRFMLPFPPELDIVVWAPKAASASRSSALANQFFNKAAAQNLHLSLATLPVAFFEQHHGVDWDQEQITCLRSCLMKPEHLDWLNPIWSIIEATADDLLVG
jgi:glutamate/tyrosine decarboxylase-like PLP-dependent enzyme